MMKKIDKVCEICRKEKFGNELINIGLDLSFHIGEYGGYNKKDYEKYYKKKPECVCVVSIYLCMECKNKIINDKSLFFGDINIIPKLKELIKADLINKMILENL